MFEPHEYAITVRKVSIDGEQIFEAQVRELPYVAEYAETFEEAYQLAIDTIQTSMAMFAEKGKPFPPPSQPEEDEELSLNQYILSLLSYRVGAETAQKLNFARAGLQLAQ